MILGPARGEAFGRDRLQHEFFARDQFDEVGLQVRNQNGES
jgi:hypothetical protein